MAKLSSEFEATCPCCHATLTVDAGLKRVVAFTEAERQDKPQLDQAQRILADERARREAIFEQSVSDERGRGATLSKRFDEALKEANRGPVERPTRDFDFD